MKKMPVDEVWQYLPDEAKWLAADEDGAVYWFTALPAMAADMWRADGANWDFTNIPIDFGTDDWTQTLRQRPVKIEPGMFGKAWATEIEMRDDQATWGYVDTVFPTGVVVLANSEYRWPHFRPGLPKERIKI